jgi:ankyrin repeat protein
MLREDEDELASSIVGVDEAREKMRTQKISRKLWSAIQEDDTDELEELLKQGADINTISSNYRQLTPLQQAIEDDNFVSAVILLEHGADPNAPSLSESRPLHLAVEQDSLEMIRLLLHKGANPNATDGGHQTPLLLAANYGRLEAVRYFLTRDDVDINIPDAKKRTVLHDACAKGWADVVEKLLAKGASVEAHDKENRTPIFDASTNGEVGVLDLLLAAGAKIDARDSEGRTPIYDAAAADNIEVVKRLIAKGAAVNVEDATGKSLLHFVSAHDRAEVVRVLVAHGASVNTPARDGSTPLHEALRYGAVHAADQLIRDHGAEIAIQNTAADGNPQPKILEPSWNKLFHLPEAGHRNEKVDLSVSPPEDGSEEKSVCEGFEAAVWPWPPVPFVLSTPTVQDLLYSTPSPLTTTRTRQGTTWIHIPANNVRILERWSQCRCPRANRLDLGNKRERG